MELADEIVEVGDRRVAPVLLGLEDLAVELDRSEEQIEDAGRELEAAEAKIVEELLELVRERRHARRAEEPREALQRVHRAEDVVDEAGVDAADALALVDREQIAAEALDDLLRLGEELLPRAIAVESPISRRLPLIESGLALRGCRGSRSPRRTAPRARTASRGTRRRRGRGRARGLCRTIASR